VQEAADGIFRGLCAWFSPDTSDHHREYWRKGGGLEEEEPLEDHALNPRLHFLFSDLYSPRVQRISESFPNVTVLTTEWIKQSVTEGKLINAGRYVLADPQLLSYIEENKLTDKDTNIPQTAKRKISEENAAPNEKRPKRIAKRTKGKKPKKIAKAEPEQTPEPKEKEPERTTREPRVSRTEPTKIKQSPATKNASLPNGERAEPRVAPKQHKQQKQPLLGKTAQKWLENRNRIRQRYRREQGKTETPRK